MGELCSELYLHCKVIKRRGAVAQAYKVEIRRITVQDNQGKKLERPSQSIKGMVAQACDPSYKGDHTWEDCGLRLVPGKNTDLT
jgi:hypothetical protein